MTMKEKLAASLAKQSFNSPAFQKSWANHMQVFGPILEHAFDGNYVAKIHLVAALNQLGAGQLPQSLFQLQQLKAHMKTDADQCAYYFFLGFHAEVSKDQEQAIAMYAKANVFGHKLYLPYMKVAKQNLEDKRYEEAEKDYRCAIDCFTGRNLPPQETRFYALSYTNLATCLMNLNRCQEAEEALNNARGILPDAPGLADAEKALAALRQAD